jgi:hypothetical protein
MAVTTNLLYVILLCLQLVPYTVIVIGILFGDQRSKQFPGKHLHTCLGTKGPSDFLVSTFLHAADLPYQVKRKRARKCCHSTSEYTNTLFSSTFCEDLPPFGLRPASFSPFIVCMLVWPKLISHYCLYASMA